MALYFQTNDLSFSASLLCLLLICNLLIPFNNVIKIDLLHYTRIYIVFYLCVLFYFSTVFSSLMYNITLSVKERELSPDCLTLGFKSAFHCSLCHIALHHFYINSQQLSIFYIIYFVK